MVVNGLKMFFFLNSWKVKVLGNSRFYLGESGTNDILKA